MRGICPAGRRRARERVFQAGRIPGHRGYLIPAAPAVFSAEVRSLLHAELAFPVGIRGEVLRSRGWEIFAMSTLWATIRLRNFQGLSMRAGTYYAIAAVLVLATLPMYRYIFQHARELDRPPPVAVPLPAPVEPPASVLVARSPSPMAGPALMDGEECHGGYVFLVSGTAYRQAVGAGGRPVRCEGRNLLRDE